MGLLAEFGETDFGEAKQDALQHQAFDYFLHETNLANGLVADKSQPGAPASIAAVGFALTVYPAHIFSSRNAARNWRFREP